MATLSSAFAPRRALLLAAAALAVIAAAPPAYGQSYTAGQNVSPAFEGWERDADGTRYFLFGYMNRNWEEELNVEVTVTVVP